MASRAVDESVPSQSWKERMRVVPHSRASRLMRLLIIAGASSSRSTYEAPAWMAFISLASATLAGTASDMRQVATRGVSESVKSSSISSWLRSQLSRRISAISIAGLSRMS